jgi:apolipoprotein N-acyltransferase
VRALPLGPYRIGVLICYEDILPGFARRVVRETRPHLLVNLTNDAWFGDTNEPWIHLALAKLRAVEHRRFLARATNTGVSAVIDPAGRVVTRSGTFTRETLQAEVALLDTTTVYARVGDWPSWAAVLAVTVLASFPRRRVPAEGEPTHS